MDRNAPSIRPACSHPAPARLARKLRDTSGSSIVLALAFFTICAIIGSIVLTAASVNTKATVTYQETQQVEYTVTSAADVVGAGLAGVKAVWSYPGATADAPDFNRSESFSDPASLMADIWEKYGQSIWQETRAGSSYEIPDTFTVSAPGLDDVYVRVSFDADLNVSARISLSADKGANEKYDEIVSVQATPRFDTERKLVGTDWETYSVAKAASATEGADPGQGGAAS